MNLIRKLTLPAILACGRACAPALAAIGLLSGASFATANAQSLPALISALRAQCGAPEYAAYGYYDYRDPGQQKLIQTANRHHFNENVQSLTKGQTTERILPDLDYILKMLPNHYGALQTVSKYYLKGGRQDEFPSADCYFYAALNAAPDDTTVKLLYASHLVKANRGEEGRAFLDAGVAEGEKSPEVRYNAGLLYADMKDFDRALREAHEAYRLGYPLPGLRRKLERLGVWKDAQPAATP